MCERVTVWLICAVCLERMRVLSKDDYICKDLKCVDRSEEDDYEMNGEICTRCEEAEE
ncbi:hypothetical protein OC834_004771 [Tilletia horrida]|uniref:Uncharacterized protein n=1 Tax=Tilletia horrida TaxID=155126 RepID=A0AAN6G9E9_9BASI|nr:hypothetical protein OC834_004771 [Tilletia horrida]KAK0528047.1 hypothetical protein OC842_004675 [Tilletia horrida]KAK0559070.1 hypothetical protein OC844_004666 [Tilletia horrida]